jgi:Protein of unknown function (DUF4238)
LRNGVGEDRGDDCRQALNDRLLVRSGLALGRRGPRPYIARMSKEGKDHYIPVFYLSQWNGADHQLCEFSKGPDGKINPERIGPKGTGFMRGLYSVPDLPPEKARYVETEFMQKLDDKAARALQAMLAAGTRDINLSDTLSEAWASFLYSLILRVPETMTTMQKQLDGRKLKVQEALPVFLKPGLVVRELVAMQWRTKLLTSASRTMLTSDRPVIMTNGFAHHEGHVAIPLSPTTLFVATRNAQTYSKINAMSDDLTVKAVNSKVCEQAVDYVYGVDDRQLRFVANLLGRRIQSTPLG